MLSCEQPRTGVGVVHNSESLSRPESGSSVRSGKYHGKRSITSSTIKMLKVLVTSVYNPQFATLLHSTNCTHAQCGISQIDHIHSCVVHYNPLLGVVNPIRITL